MESRKSFIYSSIRKKLKRDSTSAIVNVDSSNDEDTDEEQRDSSDPEKVAFVVREMIETEEEFLASLQGFSRVFFEEEFAEGPEIDFSPLLDQIGPVLATSDAFLNSLLLMPSCFPCVGHCFLIHSEDIRRVFANYCIAYNSMELQLKELHEKYPQAMDNRLARLKEEIDCFSIESVLIKPVQRVLKYPLFMRELIRYTERDDPDLPRLKEAIGIASSVAKFINESKRNSELGQTRRNYLSYPYVPTFLFVSVEKYRRQDSANRKASLETISNKISGLSMHGVKKKYSRLTHRIMVEKMGIGFAVGIIILSYTLIRMLK